MYTKQSPTNLGLPFGFGGKRGGNCLVVFATHFNYNNSLLISLQISLLFMFNPALSLTVTQSLHGILGYFARLQITFQLKKT